MKAYLLKVGIDSTQGGAHSVVFKDRTYEFIPIPDLNKESLKETLPRYSQIKGLTGKKLIEYLPNKRMEALTGKRLAGYRRRKKRFEGMRVLPDPGFDHFSKWSLKGYYGDFWDAKKFLRDLEKGDYIFFYSHMVPYEDDSKLPEGEYLFATMRVKRVLFGENLKADVKRNPRLLKHVDFRRLVREDSAREQIEKEIDENSLIMIGFEADGDPLLPRAIHISDTKPDSRNRRQYYLSKDWAKKFGTIQKYIQRSTCKIAIDDAERALKKIQELFV